MSNDKFGYSVESQQKDKIENPKKKNLNHKPTRMQSAINGILIN